MDKCEINPELILSMGVEYWILPGSFNRLKIRIKHAGCKKNGGNNVPLSNIS